MPSCGYDEVSIDVPFDRLVPRHLCFAIKPRGSFELTHAALGSKRYSFYETACQVTPQLEAASSFRTSSERAQIDVHHHRFSASLSSPTRCHSTRPKPRHVPRPFPPGTLAGQDNHSASPLMPSSRRGRSVSSIFLGRKVGVMFMRVNS